MSPWTRISLTTFAAGYDAVIQLSCPLLTRILQQQSFTIPTLNKSYVTSSPPGWLPAELESIGPQSSKKYLTLKNQGDNQLKIVKSSVSFLSKSQGVRNYRSQEAYHGLNDYSDNEVHLDLEVFNASESPVTIIAQPTVGSLVHSLSTAVTIEPGSNGSTRIILKNIPEGNHPVEFQIVDLLGGIDQVAASGELEVIRINPPEKELPGEFVLDEDSIREFASKELLGPPDLGDSIGGGPPPVGLVTYKYKTAIQATTSPFSIECNASTPTIAVLISDLHLQFKVEEIKSTTTGVKSGRYHFNSYTGELLPEYIVLQSTKVIEERDITGPLKVEMPLNTRVNAATQVVDLTIDLGQSTITFDTMDNIAQGVFQQEVKPYIMQIVNSKGSLQLAPSVSLLGVISTGTNVQELSIQRVDVKPLPAGGTSTHSCFSLGFILSGSGATPSNIQSFIGQDDFAFVISGRVIAAIASYRWRIGDYPKELLFAPVELPDEFEEDGKKYPVLLYERFAQKGIVDKGGLVMGRIRLAGPQQYGILYGVFTYVLSNVNSSTKTHSEDHLLLGGLGDFEIIDVLVKKETGLALLPATEKQKYQVPPELKNVLFEWPFKMFDVTPPSPHPNPYAEQHIKAMRSGVTRHVSRPFANEYTITLTARLANGNENLLLSSGNITL